MESTVGIKCSFDDDSYDSKPLSDSLYLKCLGMIVLTI